MIDLPLMWQMAGLGLTLGQAHHFRDCAREKTQHGSDRYTIADIACWPWTVPYAGQGQKREDFPAVKTWFERMQARPAVARRFALGAALRNANRNLGEKAREILFGRRARS